MQSSPFLRGNASVSRVMTTVLLALLPAITLHVVLFGPAILIQLAIASSIALVSEAAILALRGKPAFLFLKDGSALVTAWLVALSCPPLAPWWVVAGGVLFALLIAKHLYGGLGQNPFNPAMVAFAVLIISYPAIMSQWPSLTDSHAFSWQLAQIFGSAPDAVTGATPLDALKTGLRMQQGGAAELIAAQPEVFGAFGGKGWEWIALAYLAGGLFMARRGLFTLHAPVAFLATLFLLSGVLHLVDSARYAGPLLHLFSGGSMLAAWFIITDPVTGATTPRGKILFGAGVAITAYVIRVFGNFPDGIAFGVLFLNLCVPLIDMHTQPPVFGKKKGGRA